MLLSYIKSQIKKIQVADFREALVTGEIVDNEKKVTNKTRIETGRWKN